VFDCDVGQGEFEFADADHGGLGLVVIKQGSGG
jgi:hypothetical protein